MTRFSLLREMSRQIIDVLRWLDANFERMMAELRINCREATDKWLGDMIVDSAFASIMSVDVGDSHTSTTSKIE